MTPTLYRYRDTESVIKHLDGYAPGEGWEPLYSQDEVDKELTKLRTEVARLEAALKRANNQAEHFEREWYLRGDQIDDALERAAKVCEALRDTISDPLVIGDDVHHAAHNVLQSAADAIRKESE